MPTRMRAISVFVLMLGTLPVLADSPSVDTSRGDAMVAEYFRTETDQLTRDCLADIHTLEDWTARRETYRRQLLEMLGLDPMPERSPLQTVITGTLETDELIVEKLHFQSLPGLYVTANLYRPAKQDGPLPAILYVCGHGRAKQDGVSLGNKTVYQHHGAWFARHGYVCLTIDTIQLGEIEGLHHGTYREGMWWWNNRGYTPAGVEAWNCVRSLDYLETRPEVDAARMGVTGRSGGGAYSWWIAAIDDRIQAAVPVAGITSLKNHVVDGCVEGHCDCMYMVNTYRWDYPLVAALVAPRPLLISNTDKDRIFPLEGVIDVHAKVRRIYELYDAEDKLGLQITEGPHKDTQELRVHAFRWFNRFLKGTDELLQSPATPYFEREQLRVFETVPEDERVTSIHESFVPAASLESLPQSRAELDEVGSQWMQALREKIFRGWPQHAPTPTLQASRESRRSGVRLRTVEFVSQDPFQLTLYLLDRDDRPAKTMNVHVLDQSGWERLSAGLAVPFGSEFAEAKADEQAWQAIASQLEEGSLAVILPRGVGPTQWTLDSTERIHIRRRFMQLGQTLAGMQIYDVVRALQLMDATEDLRPEVLRLSATGEAATWALFASLFVDNVDRLELTDLPTQNREAPDLLNVSRFVEVPHVALLAASRTAPLRLRTTENDREKAWQAIVDHNALAGEWIQLNQAGE